MRQTINRIIGRAATAAIIAASVACYIIAVGMFVGVLLSLFVDHCIGDALLFGVISGAAAWLGAHVGCLTEVFT